MVPGVGSIVAVASGKGGVGKSTTAVNLALGLAANGLAVGILDADIYGPSMPRLLGISGRPRQKEGRILMPMEKYGLKVMSMGFLVEEETPMIWRGPMVISALTQMLREVDWGELDVLVVDMPPGTGDAQLTMAQQVPLAGAVIVSTPQDLALIDARKGLNMFRKVSVPVLGIVENMSYFIAPDTGRRYDIFGHGGARREADAPRRALPRRDTADHGHPRDIRRRHARRRRRPGRPGGEGLPRDRGEGLGRRRGGDGRGRAQGAEDHLRVAAGRAPNVRAPPAPGAGRSPTASPHLSRRRTAGRADIHSSFASPRRFAYPKSASENYVRQAAFQMLK